MTPVFKQIKTVVNPVTGYVAITWTISPGFKPANSSLLFYVETAYSGGDWTRLNALAPVIDSNTYVDSVQRSFNILFDVYYRVVMVDGVTSYVSIPEKVGTSLNRAELRLANEWMRRKYFQFVKRTGIKGYLLKRRDWGTYCSCYDVDMGNAPSSSCPLCYGVGFLGGYYPAIEFWIEDVTKSGTERHRDGQTAVELSHIKKSRCVAYPVPAADDLWVSASNGERYKINPETTQECFIRDIQVIEILTLEKLPPTSIYYDVPVVDSDPNGWLTGFGMIKAQTDMQSLTARGSDPNTPVGNNKPIIRRLVAGETLTAYQLVRINSGGRVVKVTANDAAYVDTVQGMTMTSASTGAYVQVIWYGSIDNVAWSLTPGASIYVGVDGAFSLDPEADNLAYTQRVGTAESSNSILISIQKGVIL